MAGAIVRACDEIAAGRLHEAFIVDPHPGRAGTSLNMNANGVIANRAIELLGGEKGDYALVSPTTTSTTASPPTMCSPRRASWRCSGCWCGPRSSSSGSLRPWEAKAEEFDGVLKMGRTRMQGRGAHPSGAGVPGLQPGGAPGHRPLLSGPRTRCAASTWGVLAIGTGINADERYLRRIIPNLSKVTGLELVQAFDLIDATQNLDGLVAVSGAVKTCAVNLSKMSNDLRLMSSGPAAASARSTCRPGRSGSLHHAGEGSPRHPRWSARWPSTSSETASPSPWPPRRASWELNAFRAHHLLQPDPERGDPDLRGTYLVDNCVTGITANRERCRDMVEHSVGIITAPAPHVGC